MKVQVYSSKTKGFTYTHQDDLNLHHRTISLLQRNNEFSILYPDHDQRFSNTPSKHLDLGVTFNYYNAIELKIIKAFAL